MTITKIRTVDKQWHCTVSVSICEKEEYLELINNGILKGKSKNNLIFRSSKSLDVVKELTRIRNIIDPPIKKPKQKATNVKKKKRKKKNKKRTRFYPSTKLSHKENYHNYLKTTVWRNKRKSVLKRDKRICQHCGAKKRLQVHHITYVNVFYEKLDDLITLCRSCHEREHGLK